MVSSKARSCSCNSFNSHVAWPSRNHSISSCLQARQLSTAGASSDFNQLPYQPVELTVEAFRNTCGTTKPCITPPFLERAKLLFFFQLPMTRMQLRLSRKQAFWQTSQTALNSCQKLPSETTEVKQRLTLNILRDKRDNLAVSHGIYMYIFTYFILLTGYCIASCLDFAWWMFCHAIAPMQGSHWFGSVGNHCAASQTLQTKTLTGPHFVLPTGQPNSWKSCFRLLTQSYRAYSLLPSCIDRTCNIWGLW